MSCECDASPVLDEHGNYSVALVKSRDNDWWVGLFGGEWEILSPDIDTEEPEAAHIISIALNRLNDTAMKTTHVEVWHALKDLLKPDPHGIVLFEPVRDKLVNMYGAYADDKDLLYLFRFMMSAGGKDSCHLKDMEAFMICLLYTSDAADE